MLLFHHSTAQLSSERKCSTRVPGTYHTKQGFKLLSLFRTCFRLIVATTTWNTRGPSNFLKRIAHSDTSRSYNLERLLQIVVCTRHIPQPNAATSPIDKLVTCFRENTLLQLLWTLQGFHSQSKWNTRKPRRWFIATRGLGICHFNCSRTARCSDYVSHAAAM